MQVDCHDHPSINAASNSALSAGVSFKAVEEAVSYNLLASSASEMSKSSLGSENTIFIPNEYC